MSVDSVLTRADAVKVGDHVRERRTGEIREVVAIVGTLTERRFVLDDGTAFDAMFLDTVHVTHAPATDREYRCEHCGDALPSLTSRAAGLPTPDLIRRGFDPDKIVCPECVNGENGSTDR